MPGRQRPLLLVRVAEGMDLGILLLRLHCHASVRGFAGGTVRHQDRFGHGQRPHRHNVTLYPGRLKARLARSHGTASVAGQSLKSAIFDQDSSVPDLSSKDCVPFSH